MLHRRHGIVFGCGEPPSPSPTRTSIEHPWRDTPKHLRHLSLPTGREIPVKLVSKTVQPPARAPSPTSTASPATAKSLHSTSSAHFRIRRKPAPSWPEEDLPDPPTPVRTKTPAHPSRWSVDVSPPAQEVDELFDELFDKCRTAATSPLHRRTQSTPASDITTLHRTHAVRLSRRALSPSKTQLSQPQPQPPQNKKHSTVPALNPFFPSGRSFEPIRAKKPAAGRVQARVRELERVSVSHTVVTTIL